jgi:host factor-I protein
MPVTPVVDCHGLAVFADQARATTKSVRLWKVGRKQAMDNKPAQNIQDSFLNTARKDKSVITIYLLSGVKLTGRIRSFDKYSVVLETSNQEQLIFKHAISTVVISRAAFNERHDTRPAAEPSTAPTPPVQNSTSNS